MGSPLVVRTGERSATSGMRLVDSVAVAASAAERGDWIEAGVNSAAAGLDLLGLVADPLGSLLKAGFGWAIEHVSFLREPFDALMGNPDAIRATARTWQNVGREVHSVAADYRSAVDTGTADWLGLAGDAYRWTATLHAEGLDAMGHVSAGMAAAVAGAGTLVATVRAVVRDLIGSAIAEIVRKLIQWVAATLVTAGIAAGGAIADIIHTAVSWANKIRVVMDSLGRSLRRLWELLDRLGRGGREARVVIEKFVHNNRHGGTLSLGNPTKGGPNPRLADNFQWKPTFTPGPDGGRTRLAVQFVKQATKVDDTLGGSQPGP